MNALKHICQSIIQLVKQVGALPQMIANASKQRQRQAVLNEREAERLDRICNPSKYRGK
jgi:type IV secretory pathway VirB4 component